MKSPTSNDEPASCDVVAPFVFGGLAVQWVEHGAEPERVSLPAEYAEHAGRMRSGAVEIAVRVVDATRAPSDDTTRAMRWRWHDGRGIAWSRLARVEIEQVGARSFVAEASSGPGAGGRAAVLSLLAATLAERVGGLVLHATAIVVAGRAVLFVGPSGAGKTTSARQVRGATWLARDRALVVPDAAGEWVAWGVPGGDELPLQRAADVCAPVACVLRVLRSATRSRIVRLGRASTLLRLRESIQSGGLDLRDEAAALEAAVRLVGRVEVAGVEVVLGEDLDALVASVLDGGSAARAAARPSRSALAAEHAR